MMVAPRGEESRAPHVEEQVEAQVVAVEADSALQVGNLEVDVSNAGLVRDGWVCHS